MKIHIDISQQQLHLLDNDQVIQTYTISTASNGPGELQDSECTPRGNHAIYAKIGAEAPSNAVYVGRVPTGEILTPELEQQHPGRDWILTRILWLEGLEPGKNQGGKLDTQARYIYIHGCPDSTKLGIPGSHGCIRMHNPDIIALFGKIDVGTKVSIT